MLIWMKPPTLAPPEKRRGGPTNMESISHRPSLKYTKHQRCKPGAQEAREKEGNVECKHPITAEITYSCKGFWFQTTCPLRLPCWKVPREGRQQHASAQIPAHSRPLPPQCPGGEAHLPPWLSGLRVSPCHHLQKRMLPCEPGWGSPGSREAQRGPEPCDLGPAPCPCLPGHRGDLGFMLLGCMD